MRTLIKLGGTLLDEPQSRQRLATEIGAFAAASGNETVVVHGGGRQMTRFLTERGIESRFVNGLRVTTPAIIDALLKVIAGSVNCQLVSSFVAAGARAVGLTGLDAALVETIPLGGEYGAVGKPVRTNPELLDVLCSAGFLPVVACIGGDAQGDVYNVNADQMAVACASGFRAERLYFLTDVDGVRDHSGATAESLTPGQIEALIRDGTATGGMQAKLEAARLAISCGVAEVVIAPGGCEGIMKKLQKSERTGTRISEKVR